MGVLGTGNGSVDKTSAYLFCQGTDFFAYDRLGCHRTEQKNGLSYIFRVWAPGADYVSLVGDFCGWESGIKLKKDRASGIWSVYVQTDTPLEGSKYKYRVTGGGKTVMKADPYAFRSESGANTASVVCDIGGYEWTDGNYKETVKTRLSHGGAHFWSAPMNIYEMHFASWKNDGCPLSDGKHYRGYRETADELSVYLKDMGYTHVELMPIAEHPFDGSWGYQVCGYYAPTSRFGSPADFMYFVDKMHSAGIGVILDWVPAHFPKDGHGLYEFDGHPLYEYQGRDRMEQKSWGTRCFDVGRPEVQSFLVSNALFWIREYHIDGLRIDAVASMLYLDYDKKPGEWIPNSEGTNHNLEAEAFFKKLNTAVFAEFPEALMVAEESTAWPMVTKPVSDGGLGFNFKWNMGWANDMFEYVSTDPFFRKHVHTKLTFPMMYAFSENYILPVSHDEVVHGKKSLLDKMFGGYDEKFACMRTFLTYMMTFPGKKLMFMGTEYAPFREWDYENQLEWFMLDYPRHAQMKDFVRELNHIYLGTPELWEIDDGWEGFEWIEPDQADMNTLSYKRRGIDGSEVIIALNFSPVTYENYRIRKVRKGKYESLISSDEPRFGGNGVLTDVVKAKRVITDHKYVYVLDVKLPGYGAVIYRVKEDS